MRTPHLLRTAAAMVAAVVGGGAPAAAQGTADDFLFGCEMDFEWCQDVIVDYLVLPADGVCAPNSLSGPDAANAVANWLYDRPEYAGVAESVAIDEAMRALWPCP